LMYYPGVQHRESSAGAGFDPPEFLRLAGHPLRWRLLGELARSDRQVTELTELVGKPQNLVSYHVGLLRKGGLVHGRRSSFDGRDTYYAVDLSRCASLLADAGGALHPALMLASPPQPEEVDVSVLFLCTGNSARSQMAEGLLRRRGGDRVLVRSAGSHPKPVHSNAVKVMSEYGVDLTAARSKHLDEFSTDRFDYVITLCDKVREVCPALPGDPAAVHWSTVDPAGQSDGVAAFRRTAAELAGRVGFLQYQLGGRAATA
jgi:ArsR family transcriptional regulator, arsenate/arsenite/antimonite-responsive transcriptional repressor / arsenate reductase (thioredoxin)